MLNLSRWVAAFILMLSAVLPRAAVAQPVTDPLAWREDLRFMAAELQRRHPNLFHTVPRERFDAAVAALDARIPTLARHQVLVEMMRIVAMVGDGHTRLDPRKDARYEWPSLPLRLYLFEEGLYVRAAAPAQRELVGARIDAIGGIPVAEALRRAAELVSRDNEMGVRLMAPILLNRPHVLHALGLSTSVQSVALTLSREGRAWNVVVPAGEVEPPWPPDTDVSLLTPPGWIDARRTPSPPLWLAAPLSYFRLVDLPQHDAVYAQLNMVTDADGETLAQFGARIRERVDALRPRALVLDLRLNLGGNGDLRHVFVRELVRAESPRTTLYLLTARGTFSATQFILNDLARLANAVIVGEPASSRPSSYGDGYRTALPRSGISLRTSILWWQSEQDRRPWTPVEIAAPLTFAAYAQGEDPPLDAALGYRRGPAPAERLLTAARSGGPAAVLEAVDRYRHDPRNRYADQAEVLALATLRLADEGQAEAALAVARANAEAFPMHVDSHAVLASVAAAQKPDIAAWAARRTLVLDPNNRFARSVLERLGRNRAE